MILPDHPDPVKDNRLKLYHNYFSLLRQELPGHSLIWQQKTSPALKFQQDLQVYSNRLQLPIFCHSFNFLFKIFLTIYFLSMSKKLSFQRKFNENRCSPFFFTFHNNCSFMSFNYLFSDSQSKPRSGFFGSKIKFEYFI